MDEKDELLNELGKSMKKSKKSRFSIWPSSPTKSVVTGLTIATLLSLFGNFLIFILLALSTLVYGYRIRERNDEKLLKLLADFLTALGKNSLIFVFTAMILGFAQASIYVSEHVPKMYSLIPQSGIVIVGTLYLLTLITNLVRMKYDWPPVYSPFSVVPLFFKFAWRFSKKYTVIAWKELMQSRG